MIPDLIYFLRGTFPNINHNLSSIDVESKVAEMSCDDEIGFLNFQDICTSEEKP